MYKVLPFSSRNSKLNPFSLSLSGNSNFFRLGRESKRVDEGGIAEESTLLVSP